MTFYPNKFMTFSPVTFCHFTDIHVYIQRWHISYINNDQYKKKEVYLQND